MNSNIVDENGDPHFEKIAGHISKLDEEIRDVAQNIFTACQNPQGNDKCERAFSIHKCWKTTDPKVMIVFASFCLDVLVALENFFSLFEKCFIPALLHRLNGHAESFDMSKLIWFLSVTRTRPNHMKREIYFYHLSSN